MSIKRTHWEELIPHGKFPNESSPHSEAGVITDCSQDRKGLTLKSKRRRSMVERFQSMISITSESASRKIVEPRRAAELNNQNFCSNFHDYFRRYLSVRITASSSYRKFAPH
jgi:hypothetical protein